MNHEDEIKTPENQWKIKNMPLECRPDEKLMLHGAEVLNDAELIAIIIRTGSRDDNSVELARKILKCGGDKGLIGLCQVDIEELLKVHGVGYVKAVQIKAVAELTRRIAKGKAKGRLILDSPESVANYCMEDMRHKDKECFTILCVDNKNALLSDSLISVGTVNSAIASPREVFLEALKHKAVGIILVHNHPSGDPTPSHNDILATRRIKELGEILGINMIDHIIIGDNNYASLNERRLM